MSEVVTVDFSIGQVIDRAEAPILSAAEPTLISIEIAKKLRSLATLAEKGRLDGLVLAGMDPATGLFLTEVLFDPATEKSEMFQWVGVLEGLKLEISEQAALAATIDDAGNIIDPFIPDQDDDE